MKERYFAFLHLSPTVSYVLIIHCMEHSFPKLLLSLLCRGDVAIILYPKNELSRIAFVPLCRGNVELNEMDLFNMQDELSSPFFGVSFEFNLLYVVRKHNPALVPYCMGWILLNDTCVGFILSMIQ